MPLGSVLRSGDMDCKSGDCGDDDEDQDDEDDLELVKKDLYISSAPGWSLVI